MEQARSVFWNPIVGSRIKVARRGPTAAPIVLHKVTRPVHLTLLFCPSWTALAIEGNNIPEKKEAGNIRASDNTAISHQRSR